MINIINLSLLGILLLSNTAIAANDLLSDLESRIESEGARAVLAEIVKSFEFGEVLDGISSGDKRWIELGFKLLNESDAGATSMLRESFAMALIPSPTIILAYQEQGRLKFTINELCGAAFIDEPSMGYKEYFDRAEQSVLGMNLHSLERVKQNCLKALKSGRRIYKIKP